MGKGFLGLFGKKKNKANKNKKLISEPPTNSNKNKNSKAASTKPSPPRPNIITKPSPSIIPEEDDTVQGSSVLTDETTSMRSELSSTNGSLSSINNINHPHHHHNNNNNNHSTLNVIVQAPEEFEEEIGDKEEEEEEDRSRGAIEPEIRNQSNIVDLDETIVDDDEDDDVVRNKDQAVFAALSSDDNDNGEHDDFYGEPTTNSGDEQKVDSIQEDRLPTDEDQQPQDYDHHQGVTDENGITPDAKAAEYYDYGDAAPSIPEEFLEDEEPLMSADESDSQADDDDAGAAGGMSETDAAAYYDYGDADPSIDEEEEEKVISADEASVDGTPDPKDAAAFYGYGDAAPSVSSGNLLAGANDEPSAATNDATMYDYGDGAPTIGARNDEGSQSSLSQNDEPPHQTASAATNDAAIYDYGDAAPTIGARNDEGSQSPPSQNDGPKLLPPIQSSEQPPPAPVDTEASQAAKLYQAKRHRLKQRRLSQTTVQQRTERAAARRNKLLMKKFLQKEMSEEDDYIQTHLGCDDKGKCLRHPNMTIVGKVKEFRFESVFSCKVCHSEQKAGGVARQRKSMCFVIGDIKSMQKDRRSWRQRTKIMHHGKEYDSDEDSHDGSKQSDSSQSLDSLEKITGFFAEGADEEELSRRDDAWKEKTSGRVAQVRAWDGKAALKCNPVFAKYFRMVSLGVPPDAVKQACEFDGWDPRVMDLDPNRPLLDQLYSTRTWKKSEKEDLLLNIRLCMGQESTAEESGDSLMDITDNVFEAYCKKKESIELHRKEVKRQEESQQWIGSGVSLLKKRSSKRNFAQHEKVNEKKDDAKESGTKVAESNQAQNKTLSSIGENPAEEQRSAGKGGTEESEVEVTKPQQLEQLEAPPTLSLDSNENLPGLGDISEGEEEESENNNFAGDFPNNAPQPAGPETESPIVEEAENQAKISMEKATALANVSAENDAEVNMDAKDTSTEESPEVATPAHEEGRAGDNITEVNMDAKDTSTEESPEVPTSGPEVATPAHEEGRAGDNITEVNMDAKDTSTEESPEVPTSGPEVATPAHEEGRAGDNIKQPEDSTPVENETAVNLDEVEGEKDYRWSDDEEEVELPMESPTDGGKIRDQPMEKRKSIDSYSVACDGAATDDEMDDDDGALGGAADMDETDDELDDGGGVIEGQIDIPSTRSSQFNDNMSVASDMTGDSWKKSKRSSKRRSRRKEIENAHRLLEKKDVIVSSLVAKVERLRQEVTEEYKDGSDDERILVIELLEIKRLIAEKDAIAAGLEKQIKRQEYEANEKWRIVEDQTMEILRLKEQVAAIAPDTDVMSLASHKSRKDSKKEHSSSKSKSSSSHRKGSSSKKKKSSSSKDKKRSKDSKSRSKSKSSSKSKSREENLDSEDDDSGEWIEEEYSGDEEEFEYIDEEVVEDDDESSYFEEEIIEDDENSIEEEVVAEQ